jgi:hypothetical protein
VVVAAARCLNQVIDTRTGGTAFGCHVPVRGGSVFGVPA